MSNVINFTVNGKSCSIGSDDNRFLLQYLREDLHLMGTKNGCNKGHCGTCTVLVDDQAKKACITKLKVLDGKRIETIEFGDEDPVIKLIQNSFVEEGAVQCGFCTPGMVLAGKALILKNSSPTDEEIEEGLKNNLCRCTGYVSIKRAVKKAAAASREEAPADLVDESDGVLIGKSDKREDGLLKATGKAVYADDMYEEGMLIGKFKFSDYPHGEILNVDTSFAEKIEGVKLVLTGKDVPGLNKFGITIPQQPVLALEKAQYEGDMIAAVFAESVEAARAGVNAIEVKYRPLPVMSNPEESKVSDIYLNDTEGNLAESLNLTKGNIEKAFKDCDIIIEGEYEVPIVEHAYLEPESCFARMDNDILTVYTPSQDSVHIQESIAASLDIPLSKVRVILTVTGGAFGGKQEPTIQIQTALASMISGRPVKTTLTREESIRVSTKRHAMKIKMKHGADKNGTLMAFESGAVLDAGAYHSETRWVNFRACVASAGPYEIPNVSTSARSYYTNNPPAGAFRGFGSTQVCFASEIQMDRLAVKLGLDPFKLREINALKNGGETITGQVLNSGVGYPETINVVKKRLEELKFELKPPLRGRELGIGIASSYKNVGIGLGTVDDAGSEIVLLEDGSFEVRTGSAEIGQGTSTLIAQIAAHELKVPYNSLKVINCDTSICPGGGVTTASRQTFVTGNAVMITAGRMRKHILEKTTIGDDFSQVKLKEAYKVLHKNNEDRSLLYQYAPPKTFSFRENGNHSNEISVNEFDIHYAYCFNTCAVILEVDENTGEVAVHKIIEAQDAGKVINPQMVDGQIEGAALMGFGYGLTENFKVERGHIISDNLNKLHIPNIKESPEIEALVVEELHDDGPYGAKGLGEVPINPIAPAISNAIYNAIGVRLTSLPIKKEDILNLLNEKIQQEKANGRN